MKEKYTGYLFCYFTGQEENLQDEQVYFSVSRDGLHWKDINQHRPVLCSSIGTGGVRDPFIMRLEKNGKYVILATDLQIARGADWESAVNEGSTRIICWESEDLVNWSQPYFFETGLKDAGCVWAPEAVYDKEHDNYMVFWSSLTKNGDERKHKIYCSHTEDFHHFSSSELYLEKEKDIIDATIVWERGEYIRFLKDEAAGQILMEKGRGLKDGGYETIKAPLLNTMTGVEGPAVFQFNGEEKWCLLLDCFMEQKGYVPLITEDLKGGIFKEVPEQEYDFGELKKRHGSIMKLTEKEWKVLENHYFYEQELSGRNNR